LKGEKVKKGRTLCVMGKDVIIDMVLSLSKNSLVGKFEFIKLSRMEFMDWVSKKWKPIIKSMPRVLVLTNSWICFQFLP